MLVKREETEVGEAKGSSPQDPFMFTCIHQVEINASQLQKSQPHSIDSLCDKWMVCKAWFMLDEPYAINICWREFWINHRNTTRQYFSTSDDVETGKLWQEKSRKLTLRFWTDDVETFNTV